MEKDNLKTENIQEKKEDVKNITTPEDTNTEKVLVGEFKTTIAKNVNNHPKMVNEEKTTKKPSKKPKSDALEDDVKNNKSVAWLAYILFFIPLLINRYSPFIRHHANEGLEINIVDAVGVALLLTAYIVSPALHLLMLIFTIIGIMLLVITFVTRIFLIIACLQGKRKDTPWAWHLRIIK